ncbi:FliM/FliN family flagellar motor switch protein [Myxococcota bacterium]|nr:FliM/FliN family flagellar motor switch protein [Myxococcota bacterium]
MGSGPDAEILSREELDALLAEMPGLLAERSAQNEGTGSRDSDLELERANEAFGLEYARTISNRHERVIQFSLIGQRPIESAELAELMLPTDVVGAFQIMPKGLSGVLLLSRPFFFAMLCTLFGAGASIKSIRPPTREYTRIERRFYVRIVKEMLAKLEEQWQSLAQVSLVFGGLLGRTAIAEWESRPAMLATFDVKGFGESCRVRLLVPSEALRRAGAAVPKVQKPLASGGVSVLDVPIRLRAQVGTAELSLAEVGGLEVGQSIALDVPSDGTLTVRIGDRERFRGIAGTRGPKRAVQLQERIEGLE